MPQIVWTGLSIAVFSSLLTDMINDAIKPDPNKSDEENDRDQDFKTSLAMSVFGVGEVLGAFFIGYIVDTFGSRSACLVNVGILVATTIFFIEFLVINNYNFLTYVTTFLWGFQDSCNNTHLQEILGFEFANNSEPYAVYNAIQAWVAFVFLIVEAYLPKT